MVGWREGGREGGGGDQLSSQSRKEKWDWSSVTLPERGGRTRERGTAGLH